jgi:hypothetical protein
LLQEVLEIATGVRVSEDTLRRALHRLDYVCKRPRYDLIPDPEREKNAGSAARSGPCRGGARSWPKTRPTCCCSRRCAPPGRSAARSPGSG